MNSLFDYFSLMASNVWLYGGTFVLVLGILVFVHEWGHYIVARMCGVRVETFSIGFGKEIFGFNDRHGTRWKVSLFPLGGYVKMFGDVDPASARHTEKVEEDGGAVRELTPQERSVAFFSRSVAQRSAIVFAGPAINFLFAVAILAGLYVFYGQPVTPPVAAAIVADSAAQEAGFLPNDEVLTINGDPVRRFEDIRREAAIALDTPLRITIRRGDETIELTATPRRLEAEDRFGFRHSRGVLGVIGPLGPGSAFSLETIRRIDGVAYETVDEAREALIPKLGNIVRIGIDYGREDGALDEFFVRPLPALNEGLLDPDSENYAALVIDAQTGEGLIRHGLISGIWQAFHETWVVTASTIEALGQMFTGVRSAEELGGIIRIGAIAGDMAQAGFIALITFTALLSINLGLINLFPIPMLDGGHLVFYFFEAIKGSPVSEQIQEYAFRLGLVILVGIMLFANLNDVVQLIR
ncbi:MAG: RIP metalloprotease RseP [Alphaproteobacteria bacterium]|nr:RIP metalloprotease RseP [Alphaproteobacteria bacterium]